MKLAERLVVLCGGFQVLTWRRLKHRIRSSIRRDFGA